MKDPLKPIDLPGYVRRGIEHICNSVDRERDCRPYFRFNLTPSACLGQHEGCETPHTVGRFLHALNPCRDITRLYRITGRSSTAAWAASTPVSKLR